MRWDSTHSTEDFVPSFKRPTVSVASSALGRTTGDPHYHLDGAAHVRASPETTRTGPTVRVDNEASPPFSPVVEMQAIAL